MLLLWLLLVACQPKREPVSVPWDNDTTTASAPFDLEEIQQSGQLIALTLSGPATYYDYQGRHLGLHYLLCQRLADTLGVALRMEVCRDTAELLSRLQAGEADLIAVPLAGTTAVGEGMQGVADSLGWLLADQKPELATAIAAWYVPELVAETRQQEQQLLKQSRVRRRVFAPMLNRQGGIISRYDGLFVTHARKVGWDWRLLAAQCYQESTFDPQATSWAGARGLMQIMPQTADHLGVARSALTDPEQNIAAACRYLKELDGLFADVRQSRERQDFVLAAYNGGHFHIRDAMRLCEREGGNAHRWADVSRYVLRLSEPRYYQDPLVQHGYMRGSETVDYVARIRQRYQQYRGVRGAPPAIPQKAENQRHREKFAK